MLRSNAHVCIHVHSCDQVLYPFIDKDTKEKFCFVSGSAESPAAQAILSKNFDVDELEEVTACGFCNYQCPTFFWFPSALSACSRLKLSCFMFRFAAAFRNGAQCPFRCFVRLLSSRSIPYRAATYNLFLYSPGVASAPPIFGVLNNSPQDTRTQCLYRKCQTRPRISADSCAGSLFCEAHSAPMQPFEGSKVPIVPLAVSDDSDVFWGTAGRT